MPGVENLNPPTNNIELIAFLVVVLANVAFSYWQFTKGRAERDVKHQENANTLETIRDQVQNTHSTNLRNDIDGIHAGLETLQAMVAVNHEAQLNYQRDTYEKLQVLTAVAIKNHPKDMK